VEAHLSGALRTVGQVAGIVAAGAFALSTAGIGSPALAATLGTISKIASATAVVANIGAQLTAKKPAAQGSANQITIGANMPSPMILGESYYGGNRIHLVGYGTENDVPNAYLLAVDIYGVGGPYEELVGTYGDFTAISFDGSGKAIGHYSNNTLYRDYQLGETPESSALTPHWSGAPDWGSSYKLSGKPAIAWNARFPKDGKRFGSGFFQTGAVWKGIKLYDPRLDSTYPGGSGSQLWDDPSDTTGFAAAKATWTYSRNPGLHALRYALGTWERNESTSDPYQKVFGIGLDWDGIVVEDFVELANVCDDNGWTCNGVIQEPGDKWANLKSILQAGGAEPCFKGGKLGLRINAPRVSLDTITRDDLADGEISVPGMLSYRDRLNTIVPKYRSPNHKWEYVATQEVIQVTEYVTEDGEEKSEERQYNLVTDPTQAAQLAAYDLVAGREHGPIELPCKPRLRQYSPGDLLTLDIPEAGLEGDYIILQRSVDPATMVVNLTLVSEDPDKHAYALAQTGTMPPAITINPPEDADDVAGSTGDRQVVIEVVALKTLAADYTATINSGLLPAYIVPLVALGGSDIRTSDDVSYSISTSGVTATVDDTDGSPDKGIIEITAVSSLSGWIDLVVTVSGIAYPAKRVVIQKQVGLPPSLGGSGSKIAADNSFEVISGTSFTAITDVLTLTLASGESLYGTAPLSYDVEGTTAGSRTADAKWQYSPAGAGTWSDFASAITGSTATAGVSPESGYGDFTQSKSGLSAGDYDVRLVAALNASGRNVIFSGTATIEAKV
jgi:hypothetical protein